MGSTAGGAFRVGCLGGAALRLLAVEAHDVAHDHVARDLLRRRLSGGHQLRLLRRGLLGFSPHGAGLVLVVAAVVAQPGVAQRVGDAQALGGVALQQAAQEVLGRVALVAPGGPVQRDGVRQHRRHDLPRRHAPRRALKPGEAAAQESVHHDAHAPHVRLLPVAALKHLGREEHGGAHPLGQRRAGRVLLRAAKVDGLHRLAAVRLHVQHEVGGLHVGEAEAARVAVAQHQQHAAHQLRGRALRQPAPLLEHRLQIAAAQVLGDEVRVVLVLRARQQLHNARRALHRRQAVSLVAQVGEHCRRARHALARLLPRPLALHLDCHLTPTFHRVLRQVHRAPAALPDHVFEDVALIVKGRPTQRARTAVVVHIAAATAGRHRRRSHKPGPIRDCWRRAGGTVPVQAGWNGGVRAGCRQQRGGQPRLEHAGLGAGLQPPGGRRDLQGHRHGHGGRPKGG
mmetsp:Transcript_16406/g.42039  ORF Transcript_16406/g.42039 Transcript_16406/m.42039 type:complete len:455 (-) Transcript_16406:147-1511(-)